MYTARSNSAAVSTSDGEYKIIMGGMVSGNRPFSCKVEGIH